MRKLVRRRGRVYDSRWKCLRYLSFVCRLSEFAQPCSTGETMSVRIETTRGGVEISEKPSEIHEFGTHCIFVTILFGTSSARYMNLWFAVDSLYSSTRTSRPKHCRTVHLPSQLYVRWRVRLIDGQLCNDAFHAEVLDPWTLT